MLLLYINLLFFFYAFDDGQNLSDGSLDVIVDNDIVKKMLMLKLSFCSFETFGNNFFTLGTSALQSQL